MTSLMNDPLNVSGSEYWKEVAQNEIERTLESLNQINTNVAKNVIILGDGMSIPTLTASRIYKAQYQGRQLGRAVDGEETLLTFEQFPNVGLSKVIMNSYFISVTPDVTFKETCLLVSEYVCRYFRSSLCLKEVLIISKYFGIIKFA